MAACMRTGRPKPGRSRGFTYLWLLFVMALGGVALAALGQRQQSLQQREREAELRFRGEAIAKALASYARATPPGANPLPQRLEDLLEDRRSGSTRRHLRRLYADPFTGRADWALQIGQISPAGPAPGAEREGAGLSQGPISSTLQPQAQGQALRSGIVAVRSRARQLLMSSGLAVASVPASAPKPRVSDLVFAPSMTPGAPPAADAHHGAEASAPEP